TATEMTATDTTATDTAAIGTAPAETRLLETRSFAPDPALAGTWNVGPGIHERTAAAHLGCWEEAGQRLDGSAPRHTASERDPPTADPATGELTVPSACWFVGGRLNVAENCADRHVRAGRGGKVALHFEGEPGDRESVTYADLQRRVSQAANALTALGTGPADRAVADLPWPAEP